MRIFIGYGYNAQDRWIEEYVFPLVGAFGCEILHGKVVYGGALLAEVTKTIRTADAMIGFTTRREPEPNTPNRFRTHSWVIEELQIANQHAIPWVEVRQEGVISPGGILEEVNAQRIEYSETDRAACLVKIAQALQRFQDLTNAPTIRLGPSDISEEIAPYLDDPTFACACQTLRGAVQSAAFPIPVLPIKGGLFVKPRGLASGDLVRLTITAGGHTWRSSYESVDTVDIQVERVN